MNNYLNTTKMGKELLQHAQCKEYLNGDIYLLNKLFF